MLEPKQSLDVKNSNPSSLPLVSVIIPAYNAERFIEATLESVLFQTYRNIEVIVVDDGSKDKTAEIVQKFVDRDRRVRLIQQPNSGVVATRNLAIENARGEYISPIDADDIWYPQKLEKQVQCMLEGGSSIGLVYSWSAHIDEEGALTGGFFASNFEGNVLKALAYTYFIGNASSPIFRRSSLEKVGLYNIYAQGAEDWDIAFRIAEYYEFRVVPELLIGYRQVIGSVSRNTELVVRAYNLVAEYIQSRHPEISTNIYKWSRAEMYYYLAFMSKQSGDYWKTLSWLFQASLLDPEAILPRRGLYKNFIVAILYLLMKPIIYLFWNTQSLHQFRQKRLPKQTVFSLTELTTKVHQDWQACWGLIEKRLQLYSKDFTPQQ